MDTFQAVNIYNNIHTVICINTDVTVTPQAENSQYAAGDSNTSMLSPENEKLNHSTNKDIGKDKSSTNESDSSPALTKTHEASKNDFVPTNIAQICPTYKEAVVNNDYGRVQCSLEDVIYLITTDHGGQTEFLDLMSRFLMGPSLNLIFSRLTDPFHQVYKIYSTDEEGVCTDKEESVITLEEITFQTLASIACMEVPNEQQHSSTVREAENNISCSSKAMFIGTFRDQVTPEEFIKRDQVLKQALEHTDFYHKGIIEYATERYITLPINNRSGTQQEIDYAKTIFESSIKKNFKKVHIPCTWLMFNIVMRSKDKQTMTIEECKDIAGNLGISDTDLPNVLWFLHYRVGSLLYYPMVKGFEGIVICDVKVSCSTLIMSY